MKLISLSFLTMLLHNITFAQTAETLSVERDTLIQVEKKGGLARSMILPAVLTSYGFLALDNKNLKTFDNEIKEEIWTEHPHNPAHFDDWLQYMPGFSVYVLNCINIKGKNELVDATRLYFISSLMMTVVVQSIKGISGLKRPDGFGRNTFPSGHTSTAFVAAEFLNQEFKHRSPLYGMIGYAMATTVGYMRIYNNRHWFKDIITGAGIGIGVTRFVYWSYPKFKYIFERRVKHNYKFQ